MYVSPAETWRIFGEAAFVPLTCSLSTWMSWAPVKSWRLTVLANGWTVKPSPYVTTPSPSPPLAA